MSICYLIHKVPSDRTGKTVTNMQERKKNTSVFVYCVRCSIPYVFTVLIKGSRTPYTYSSLASPPNTSFGYLDFFFNWGKFLTGSFHSEIDLTRRSYIPLKIIKLSSPHSQTLPLIFYDGLELHRGPCVPVTFV